MKKNLKVIPLGGVEEIGINCTAIEYNEQIIIIDVGLGFPLSDQYGIDFVIPNISYLKQNRKNIEGIIITHAHLDHIGGLPYVLKDLDFPEVYASKFSIELIKSKLKEFGLETQTNIREINLNSRLAAGELEVRFFGVNHSIPESMGVIVKTPVGNIVHTGDFKFDNSPVNEPVAEYSKIAAVGAEGVLVLLSDSTNSFKKGHSKSESIIGESLEKIVKESQGRVVVATFSSLLTRLYQLIKIAERTKRKVAIVGRSMQNSVNIAMKLGYIKASKDVFIDPKNVSKYKDGNLMILATGAQGEDMAGLARMTRDTHRDIKIKKGDTVILSASIIPGNDMLVQMLIDDLSRKGAIVYHNADDMDLHSSGHGYQEDQKIMINLVKPKFFMPVHGYQSFLYKHAQTATKVGIPEENTIIAERGSVVSFSSNSWSISSKVKATPIFVSGSGIGDIGNIVLNDRQQLANYGVVVIVLHVDLEKKLILNDPEVVTRGFVFVKENQDIISKIQTSVTDTWKAAVKFSDMDIRYVKEQIGRNLKKLLYNATEREPMILPVIITTKQ